MCRTALDHVVDALADIREAAPAGGSCAAAVVRLSERLALQPNAMAILSTALEECDLDIRAVPFDRLIEMLLRVGYHVGLWQDQFDKTALQLTRTVAMYVFALDVAGTGAKPPSACVVSLLALIAAQPCPCLNARMYTTLPPLSMQPAHI